MKLINDQKVILKMLEYGRRHGVVFKAKCEELISIEIDLSLVNLAWVPTQPKSPPRARKSRELCLLMKLHAYSLNFPLPWPRQQFMLSFQYRDLGSSFRGELIRLARHNHMAIFSFPEGVHEHRLRESLRTSVDLTDKIWLRVNQRDMEVKDLTMNGVGVLIPEGLSFRVRQSVPDVALIVQGSQFRAIGKVCHLSINREGRSFCGLTLEYEDPAALRRIQELIVRKQLILAGVEPSFFDRNKAVR